MPRPGLFVVGTPKAGTTALHWPRILPYGCRRSRNPSTSCATTGPRRAKYGPGDAHSRREWVWQRADYEALFEAAPPSALLGESTPFYLWDEAAQRRIAEAVPDTKLILVLRDPVDRATPIGLYLRTDSLEPEADFLRACHLEGKRAAAGWAPFWRYLELGMYGQRWRNARPVRAASHLATCRAATATPAAGSGKHRPVLSAHARELQQHCAEDIVALSEVSGRDFTDWLAQSGRRAYSVRRS